MPFLKPAPWGRLVVALAALFWFGGTPAFAAALPAPAFLPGQPMLAGNQVLLVWSPVVGAASYVVYRNGAREAAAPSTQLLAPAPTDPGEHRYHVTAVDADGREGEPSAPGVLRVRRLTPPQSLLARTNPSEGTIGLVWSQIEGAAFYNVYRARGDERPSLLASVREPSYIDGSPEGGVTYRYTVTARDTSGVETPPSPPTNATVERRTATPNQLSQAAKIVFRAQATTERLTLDKIGQTRLDQVSYLGLDKSGSLWLVTPKSRQIHQLDSDGNPLATFGPYTSADTGTDLIPQKLDFGPDGNLYVSDALNSTLNCLDRQGNLLWSRGIVTPPPTLTDVWKGYPEAMSSLPTTPSAVLCLPDELWVTDQRFPVVYRFDYAGNLLGLALTYETLDKKDKVRLSAVGEMVLVGKDRVALSFPLAHKVVVIDRGFRAVVEIGTVAKTHVGGFVGLHGLQALPEGRLLITDPAVASVQVFDTASGDYLYHLAGDVPRPDPRIRDRADLPLGKPNLAVRDKQGHFWLYSAAKKTLVVLEPKGQPTPPL